MWGEQREEDGLDESQITKADLGRIRIRVSFASDVIVCDLPHPPPTTFARYEKSGGVTPTYNVHVKPIDDAIPKKEREKLVMQVRV